MARLVDAGEYLGVLKELAQEGRTVSVTVTGGSMAPFLSHGRDTVFFSVPESPLCRGDIVFYTRPDGRYVLHRILRVRKDGGFDIVGDAQTRVERGVSGDRIFARVSAVLRKGKMLAPESAVWRFYARFWLSVVPLRPLLMGLRASMRPK